MTAEQAITGGCACGAVRYRSDAAPLMMLNCHCRDYQRASGSGYAPIVVLPAGAVEMEGELRFHRVTGGSGNPVDRGYCAACGNPVAARPGQSPRIIGIMAGSLDDPSMHKPTVEIFTTSAHPWDHMSPETRKFERGLKS